MSVYNTLSSTRGIWCLKVPITKTISEDKNTLPYKYQTVNTHYLRFVVGTLTDAIRSYMSFRACRSLFTKKLLHFYSMLWCKRPGKFHLITKNQFHLKKVKNLGWLTPLPSTVWFLHRIVLLVTIFDWLGVYPMPSEGLTFTNLAWDSMLFQLGGGEGGHWFNQGHNKEPKT